MTTTNNPDSARKPTATLRNAAVVVTYTDKDGDDQRLLVGIDEHDSIELRDTDGDLATIAYPTREAALAIAEAFTRLSQELPEAPTND